MRFLHRTGKHFFRRRALAEADTDAAFLDSTNLPGFNTSQLEGKLVRSLSTKEVWVIGVIAFLFAAASLYFGYALQITQGSEYRAVADSNRIRHVPIFAKRGVIQDRYGVPLAWNTPNILSNGTEEEFPQRMYTDDQSFSHVLGYVREPKRDAKGNWWRESFETHGGVESEYSEILSGKNGYALQEIDAAGVVQTHIAVEPAQDGDPVVLTIDAHLNTALRHVLKSGVSHGFQGGSAVVMDINTGEIVAMTSYPSFDLNAFADAEAISGKARIQEYLRDENYPLLDRGYQGAYLPGSIVKPFVAVAALEEHIITPEAGIVSTGKLVVPNPFNPSKPTIFRDWRAHGWVNMVDAIAVSSDVYFYQVGGGFEEQRGLGINKLHMWMERFGFGKATGVAFDGEVEGNVPSVEWKKRALPDESTWNIGNTYHSSIGQYGWLVTPLQAVRAYAALANGGYLHEPRIVTTMNNVQKKNVHVMYSQKTASVIHRGLVEAVKRGTAKALYVPGIQIAAKTGTAEVGRKKEHMNSWVTGYWPAEKPMFAFAVMLEKAPASNLRGAAPALKQFFETLVEEGSPYVKGAYPPHDYYTRRKLQDTEKTKGNVEDSSISPPADTEELFVPEPEIPAYIPG